jgi:prepilin-type processing-associated H-X9-DG protein
MSNQRQIGLALGLYANQWREYTPRESGSSETRAAPPYNPAWAFVLRPFVDDLTRSDRADGGVKDAYKRAKYYRDPARAGDGHNIHYVVNGFVYKEPGKIDGSRGKPPTRLSRYARPEAVHYLSCFADDPNAEQSKKWYAKGNDEQEIAIYYDMLRPEHLVGGKSSLLVDNRQRLSPSRHRAGANMLYVDGHAALVADEVLIDVARWDDGDYLR